MNKKFFFWFLSIMLFGLSGSVMAAEIKVAVAANFTTTIKKLKPIFEKESGHKLVLHFGSTGKLYAQIVNGAPFDVFMAADVKRPKKLENDGLTLKDSRFTYASGSLVMWMPGVKSEGDIKSALYSNKISNNKISNIAITNPKVAPYGMAAKQFLTVNGLWEKYQTKLMTGNTITQTYQFVETGGVDAGFVALSQVISKGNDSYWVIPASDYTPLEQQAVILQKSDNISASVEFVQFLKSDDAKKIIIQSGYMVPSDTSATGKNSTSKAAGK